VFSSSSPGPPLYRGGCTLALPPRHLGRRPRRRSRAATAGWGGAKSAPQNPSPGWPRPRAQDAPSLPFLDGLLSRIRPIRFFPIFNYLININSFN
jgi:hypothetical protein